MRIALICGSLQARSSNRTLLERAVALAAREFSRTPGALDLAFADAVGDLPLFNPDLEASNLGVVSQWRREIATADALLIASPEYGHSLPGSLKNGIDWLIGTGELECKRVAITASVPHPDRGRRGLDALRQTLAAVSAEVLWDQALVRGPDFDTELRKLLGVFSPLREPA